MLLFSFFFTVCAVSSSSSNFNEIEKANYFYQEIKAHVGSHLPDSYDALKSLGVLYRSVGTIIDVGANIGDVSAYILHKWTTYTDVRGNLLEAKSKIPFYSLEPSWTAFSTLEKRAIASGWDKVSHFRAVHVAAANISGYITLYGCDSNFDGHVSNFCSLSPEATKVKHYGGEEAVIYEQQVEAVTLDAFSSTLPADHRKEIFLLKVDCEGHDDEVLAGATELLASRVVRFIIFEYSHRWHLDERHASLSVTVQNLEIFGYRCGIIMQELVAPLSARHPWDRILDAAREHHYDVNVVCALEADFVDLAHIHVRDPIGRRFVTEWIGDVQPEMSKFPISLEEQLYHPQMSADILLHIGHCFRFGCPSPPMLIDRDKTLAYPWYEQAFQKGSIDAGFWLGVLNHYGIGMKERDLHRAVQLYSFASQHDHAIGRLMMDGLT